MMTVIDRMEAVTGWSASTGASVYGLNDWPEYIADDLSYSVVFRFTTTGQYVTKTFSQTIAPYSILTLSLFSHQLGEDEVWDKNDFNYKIDIGSGKEYYLPTMRGFNQVSIYIGDQTTIDRIRITALTDTDDYLVVSNIVLSKDDLPLDIYVGMQTRILAEIAATYPDGLLLGTASGTTGDTYITMANVPHLARYAKVKIKDLTNSESHYIVKVDGNKFYFNDLYDGGTLDHDYSSASVYLQFPVEYGKTENDIILPSVSIWGLGSEPSDVEGSKLTTQIDTWKTSDVMGIRRDGVNTRFNIMVDCEAHQAENLAFMSAAVRRAIAKEYVFINGVKYYIKAQGPATEIEPTEAFEIIPKVQYNISVDVVEELAARYFAPKVATTNFTATIS